MQVHILLFGPAKDLVGAAELELEIPSQATVKDLRASLVKTAPGLTRPLAAVRIAVNNEFAAEDRVIKPGDEIAIIPPVSGG